LYFVKGINRVDKLPVLYGCKLEYDIFTYQNDVLGIYQGEQLLVANFLSYIHSWF